ncbi:PREDICTED: probable LRR receptor-like serine/threonine-protein kinase At4g36180 isoform X2 [Brassica oleracea var. oleracea]|uniref:probable LRR receptor-like serine/threonine-protein kinase At4g36180 isoform X2 n=1 Tax=Brassica oleracea var. oleracea TaxID=109376 RepID=UPI0006A6FB52|nr:PREDICTED: probable LRR receptor-like serine/threonine-protein kinase At4g36180 isoform X2 [Brassica oleracea var. oleracea]
MRTYERYWWWVKEKKQMALVLFMIVTLMLQLQMKGCVGCLETERTGLLQLKSYLKNGFEVEEESMMKSWSHDDPSSDCCHWERVKCSDATGGHVVHLSLKDLILASYALENQSLNLSLLHSFPRLQSLDLSFNKFSDLFDPINGAVLPSSLHVLDLAENQLSSSPKANLSRLRTLDLSGNQMNGDLSSFVSGLPSALEYLSLLDNDFNGSFCFSSLANHTRLTVFMLSSKVGMIQAQAETSWFPPFQLKMLKLKNFNLGSTIPSFLAHQHDLRLIHITYSQLKVPFPGWLVQNNTRLESIILNNNLLTELRLPRLVHGLQYLDISSNRIYDSIPEDIGIVFPHLKFMNFSSNHNRGTIPSSLGEMKSLYFLDMSYNRLYGQLPKTFFRGCYSLTYLRLSNNQLQGKVFPSHANLTSLVRLFLDGNRFDGSLEKGLLNSKTLELLDVSDNSFSGTLPYWIGKISNLSFLYMRGNKLKGQVPHQLQNLQLVVLDMSNNRFSGFIPGYFNVLSLRELRLDSNEFMGPVPSYLFKSKVLQVLDLRHNSLSGMILNTTIGNTSDLVALLLGNNSFQTHIPDKICQLSKVGLLDLSHNKFKGAIPSCFGKMPFGAQPYDDLTFGPYGYTQQLAFFQSWSYTSALDLLDNEVEVDYESIAEFVANFLSKSRYETYQGDILRYMYGLDLSSNQLSGEIPVEVWDLKIIRSLNFSSNRLIGSIPDSISKLENLESLDLSNNKLHGNIPPQLADLNSLGVFNISFNNFSGEIPFKAHLMTFDEKSYRGNPHLCGIPTNKSCNLEGATETSASKRATEEEEEGDGVIDMVWFYWTCGAVYITTSLALFAFLCIDSRWSREWFYRVDVLVHHLQRFKDGFICN